MKHPSSDQLHHFIDAGYDLIPLHQAHALSPTGKKVGKVPIGRDWQKKPALSLEEAKAHMADGGNIGIRLKRHDLVIDVDPRNFGETDSFNDLVAMYPALEPFTAGLCRVAIKTGGRSDEGHPGYHFYFRLRLPKDWDERDRLHSGLKNYPGVEFKTLGSQVLAIGSVHPDTGFHYKWALADNKLPDMDAIPELPDELFRDLWKHPASHGPLMEGADWTPEMLAEFLVQLDPVDYRNHEKWLNLMMGCHSATLGDGIDEFASWSVGDDQYSQDYDHIRYRWDTLDVDGDVTVKTLEWIAQQKQISVPRRPSADFSETIEEDSKMEGKPAIAESDKSWLAELNDTFWFVDEGGAIKIYRELYDETLERQFWAKYAPAAFCLKHSTRTVLVNKRPTELGSAWLKWPQRREADGIVFKPEAEPGILPSGALNLWQGFGVEPNPQGDCSLLYKLVSEVLAEDAVSAKYILDWMAYAVQRPHLPAEVALVFRGGKGTGKGTLGRAFFKLFGRHGMHITSPSLLTGRFNEHMRDCVALFADEAFWAGNKEGESLLKGLVTEPMLTYEGKGTNATMGRNCLHVVMASNADWVVPAGIEDERRFAVFQVSNQYRNNKAFFTELHQQLSNGGLGRLLHDLQNRDVTTFDPIGDTPKTKALADQKRSGVTKTHEAVFINATIDGSFSDHVAFEKTSNGGILMTKSDFKLLAEKELIRHRYLKHDGSNQGAMKFFNELQSITGIRIQSRARCPESISLTRAPGWEFPPLDTCREMAANWFGYKNLEDLEYDDDIEEWQ